MANDGTSTEGNDTLTNVDDNANVSVHCDD